MSEYGEVAQTVSRAYSRALFKHEKEALEEAMKMAKHYGLDDDVAEAFARQLAEDQREVMLRRSRDW